MAIGVAIIGSGIFAKERHLPGVLETPGLELKAVYSRSSASAKALAEAAPSGVELYSDDQESRKYADLLAREDVQAVIVALPILAQPEYIKQALTAGKHVLSEKPVAKDIAAAVELINWYKDSGVTATWGVAENFRYIEAIIYAASEVTKLGRVLNFRGRTHQCVKAGSKYYETSWRKVPDYQGGFVLDGGVHWVAALRLLVNPSNDPSHAPGRVAAFTNLLQEHLLPVDTVDATWKTRSGVTGTFSISFGTTMSGVEFIVACEKGTVSIGWNTVTINRGGEEEKKEFPDNSAGVNAEIKAWAAGLQKGALDVQQSPEEALKDLALIEAMLQSGEKDGAPVDLTWV